MSLNTPTTEELYQNIIAQLEASLAQSIPFIPNSFLRVLARVLAGVFITLYKYGGFIFLQMFVSTASFSSTVINGRTVTPLIEKGREVGVGDPAPAVRAELDVTVTVLNSGTLNAGTPLVGLSNGVEYVTVTAYSLSTPSGTVNVRAVSDPAGGNGAGEVGNLQAGDEINFSSPNAVTASNAVVLTQTKTGADGETEQAYRQRILQKQQARPQGGAKADYRDWATQPSGILQAYPFTANNGQVDVYIESATEADGVPTQAQLDEAADNMELYRPANDLVNTLPIFRTPWTATVVGLLSVPGTESATESAISSAVEEYFLSRVNFISGVDIPPQKNVINRSAVIGAVEDAATASGASFSGVTIARDSAPTVPVETAVLSDGERCKSASVFL